MGAARGALLIAGALTAMLAGPDLAAGAGTSAFVRIDQGGYPAAADKRAYLMSRREESGAPFSLRRVPGGEVAFAGTVGASAGSWSKRFPRVYALDFDALQATGTYTLDVGGPAPASSPPFAIASPPALYARPLANALSFYENERGGPEYIPS